jgi:hypothetical protein
LELVDRDLSVVIACKNLEFFRFESGDNEAEMKPVLAKLLQLWGVQDLAEVYSGGEWAEDEEGHERYAKPDEYWIEDYLPI